MKYEFPFRYPHTREELDANGWQQVGGSDYWEALEIVPPVRQSRFAFMQGEPLSHLRDTGEAVYMTYVNVAGRYYRKPCTLSSFNYHRYAEEIRATR